MVASSADSSQVGSKLNVAFGFRLVSTAIDVRFEVLSELTSICSEGQVLVFIVGRRLGAHNLSGRLIE
ncbi:hypothetical protein DBR36_03510 [Microbacterium sp. HMWF026]|nr:hypothetical protein DBR36_03510 [Microbacterium sp. HMWF026]